jgi:ribosome-associated translation inhibitor RaiA
MVETSIRQFHSAGRPPAELHNGISVVMRGAVTDDDADYAQLRIGAVLEQLREPVLFARVKLTMAPDPARERPAISEVALDINGEVVRAHVAAHEMRESIDALQRRLLDKLDHRSERREARHGDTGIAEPGSWRHGAWSAARPDVYDRPVDERELVRHKTFAVGELSPDEAAFDMEQLDYDFYLFRDSETHDDCVLDRRDDGSLLLIRLRGETVLGPTAVPMRVVDGVPELSVPEALARMNAGGQRFVFFRDARTGRGSVVYRRYDGHYGLITPD